MSRVQEFVLDRSRGLVAAALAAALNPVVRKEEL